MRSIFRSTLPALLLLACNDDPTGPPQLVTRGGSDPVLSAFEHLATGGYKFTIPADFNGGVFGIEIGNRLTFNAKLAADWTVDGRFNYRQTGGGEVFDFNGRVTCFHVYDTPVLERFPQIPAMTGNRAKWGGVVESSNDPTLPAGVFIWFQSIDNGEGANAPPDLSTLSGFGDEAANEAFCNSPNLPRFGPWDIQGNVQVNG